MRSLILTVGTGLVLVACSDPAGPAGTATLLVTVSTTGGDPDLDGYLLTVNDRVSIPVGSAASQSLTLEAGLHRLQLEGMAENCLTSNGGSSREITLPAGQEASVDFRVECALTGLEIRTVTGGLDLSAAPYVVRVDGQARENLPANATRVVSRLAPGDHLVALENLPANCTLEGEPVRTVTVVNRQLEPLEFDLTCRATTGVVRVAVTTTGVDLDPTFEAQVAGTSLKGPVTSGVGHIAAVPAGAQLIRLGDVASNCTPVGSAEQLVTVTAGGLTRDTASVAFALTCALNSATVTVTAPTSGVNPDNAYLAVFQVLGTGTAAVSGLLAGDGSGASFYVPAGSYDLMLTQVAANCQATAQVITVTPGQDLEIELPVTCRGLPVLRVHVSVTGTPPATGFEVRLWDSYYWYYSYSYVDLGAVAPNATLTSSPQPGHYIIELLGVPDNCTVNGSHWSDLFSLEYGQEHDIAFEMSCGVPPTVQVTVNVTGANPDPSVDAWLVYQFDIGSISLGSVPANGSITTSVQPGEYHLQLQGVATNCTVAGVPPWPTLALQYGDAVSHTFTVMCS